MFNPNVYTQFPDHYEDQQIRQQSDIWTQDELQLTKIGGAYEFGFYAVDIIDPESPVTVRVIPNGNNIWEDTTTNTVYQVNGIAGEPCEFQLKMLTYEYCNKLISPSINTSDGSYNTPRFGDEVVIREPNNIFHFDAFEGPKQTSWPSPNYDLNDFFDAWYQWYVNNWGGVFYWYYWYAPPVTYWNITPTNVDFRHTPTGIFYGYNNYATISPVMLGSKSTNLNGLSTILEYYPTQVSYLSPYVSLFFPPEAQINYQLTNFVDNGFRGISDQQNLGIKIVGATFDGFNIILRPYCFANSAYYFYFDSSINPAIESPWISYPVVHDHVTVPQNYPCWPWINDSENAEQVYPRYGSYDVVTGLITYNYYTPWNSYYYNWYWYEYGYYFPYSVSGFPYVKARFFLTQKRPVIENYDGNFCKYTYKNAIISYGYVGRVTPTGPNNSYIGGKGLQFHSKGVVCDIEVYFKRKPFPDISSIPGIQQVKSFIAYPQNIRPLDYREYSFKYYITNPIIKVFYAYYNFNDFDVAQQYITPFEIYYPKPFIPFQSWYYYYANAPFEYALNPTINFVSSYYSDYKIPFVYYDPNYDALWTPLFYDINNIPPFILTRAAGSSNYDRLSYLYYAAYPNYNYYYYDGYGSGWAGNTQVEFNGQTANMIFELNETPFYPTILYGKIWSRYDIEYSNFDSPNLAFRVSTRSYSPSEFFDVYVMHDKFATRGFGDGWFAVEIKNKRNLNRGQLNFYDPNKNLLYYGSLNFDTTNAPSGAPLSDSPILSKYFYGNYILDDVYYPNSTNYIDVYWFYSSEKSYSVYRSGVFSNDNPDNVFKPFGTFFDGNLNNTNYCQDGVYMITHNSSYSFDYYANTNLNSGFDYWRNNRTFNPTTEVIIGAFHISTQNNSFSIAAVPIYYIPDIDWTRPYKGCINSSFSIITYELSKTTTTTAYYPELEGLGEIYVKSSWWDNIENLVKIYGPNNQQLILDEDYEIKRINSELMPGDYRIKFLKPIGDLYNNEPTENPARLLDGEYKVFWPSSKETKLECISFNDNYASLYRRPVTTSSQTPYYSGYYENFYNEFQLIGASASYGVNSPVGQFYQTGMAYDNLQRRINTMSNSTVVGLSPISFYLQNCIFSGFVDDQFVAFKCDINLVENVLPGELPVNPESFNDFLYNGIYAVGNYNY